LCTGAKGNVRGIRGAPPERAYRKNGRPWQSRSKPGRRSRRNGRATYSIASKTGSRIIPGGSKILHLAPGPSSRAREWWKTPLARNTTRRTRQSHLPCEWAVLLRRPLKVFGAGDRHHRRIASSVTPYRRPRSCPIRFHTRHLDTPQERTRRFNH